MNIPNEKETGRIEAFSDGVFAIALTLLAIDLRAPALEIVNNVSLMEAVLERWTEYFAFANSFVVVLLMWICHHSIFKFVCKTDTRFMLANGLALFFVAAVSYPTSLLAKYLMTDAASAAAAFYAGYLVVTNVAFIILWRTVSSNKKFLKDDAANDARYCGINAWFIHDHTNLHRSSIACLCQRVDNRFDYHSPLDLLGNNAKK